MNVLIIDERRAARDNVSKYLLEAECVVDVCDNATAALLRVERGEAPAVILLKWGPGASDVVRKLRATTPGRRAYLIAMMDRFLPEEIASLYSAGADDFVRMPVLREELLGRVRTMERVKKLLSAAPARAETLDWSSTFDLRKSNAFRDMGRIVTDVIAGMMGPLATTEVGFLKISPEDRAATIALSLPTNQVELALSLIADTDAARVLAERLLGDRDAPPAAIDDMLREMSNMAVGMVKRAAMDDEVVLTTGLPSNGPVRLSEGATARHWFAKIDGTSSGITIVGEVRDRPNQRVVATQLREGMVVARDLMTGLGALVVPAGTRLTANMAQRVPAILGEKALVEVAVA